MKNLPPSEMIESCSVAGPEFVNIVLSKKWIAQVIDCIYICSFKLEIVCIVDMRVLKIYRLVSEL
jgi:hypothetical protein